MSIDVSAVEYTKMSLADSRDLLGRDIDCTLYANGEPHSGTFHYNGGYSSGPDCFRGGWNVDSSAPGFSAMGLYGVCCWVLSIPELSNAVYLELEIPIYINASGGFRTMFFCSSPPSVSASNPVSDFNTVSLGGNYISGSTSFPACTANSNVDYYGLVDSSRSDTGSYIAMRPIYVNGENIVLETIHFNSLQFVDGKIYLYMLTPYTYGEVVNTRPVTTTTTTSFPSSTTDINVNVDVDLTETNGILGAIRDLIANLGDFIVTGIKNLFIPTQEDLDAFKNTVEQLLRETFGGIPELEDQLQDAISGLFNVTAKTSIHFDGIQFDGHYYVPAQDVNLKPAGYDDLYTFVEMIINILATIATVNTCINLVKHVVVGEVVVDVD